MRKKRGALNKHVMMMEKLASKQRKADNWACLLVGNYFQWKLIFYYAYGTCKSDDHMIPKKFKRGCQIFVPSQS